MVSTANSSTSVTPPSSAAVSGDSSMGDSPNSATLVAMILLGAVFLAVVIALLIYRYYRRTSGPVWISKLALIRGRYRTMRNDDQGTQDDFIMGFSNPITESSSSDKADGRVTVLGYRPLREDGKKDGDYSLLYKHMFPRDRLVFGTDLGTGWFGKVYEADAYRIKPGWRRTKVVVKELRKSSNSQMKDVFLRETDVLRRVEHKNVLSVLGQATEQEPFLVILEHTPVGDLKKFLLEQRCDKKREGVPLPLRMSIDIASGLHCLHANYYYHSDLAARNCLVFPDLSVKIGDYGISRCVYKNDYYNRPNAPNTIPVRWLPPEGVVIQQDGSLVTKPPSSHGNVWSFGVTLWEIVEGGKQPYEHLSDEEVLQSVIQDRLYQLPEPHNKGNVLDLLYELMLQCWVEPERRPSVQKLESTLMSLMSGRSVPCLTTGGNMKQGTELHESQATPDTRNATQPIAVVHPLRSDHNEQSSYVSTAHPNDAHDQEQNSSDIEVTVISAESPPPVTYIGNPSEELEETSEVSEDTSTEVASMDSQPSVVVESDHELVMVPGEVIRRRGSILKNPNAPSKPTKVVHFPVNILALRTVHKYERMESFEEGNDSGKEEEDGPRDYPIASDESEEYMCKFPVEKDFEKLDLNSAEENGTDLANEPPSSPIERKIRKAARRKKLEECGQEWVAAIDSNTEKPA
ncbi:NT-3 growth factor receptor-like isoform X2 [Oculina patagonica]